MHRPLILKRSDLAHAGFEDFDVLCGGELVGRIYCGKSGSGDKRWFWGLAYGYHNDRTPTHGYEYSREAAMAASRKRAGIARSKSGAAPSLKR
jgi:hypothetical protein